MTGLKRYNLFLFKSDLLADFFIAAFRRGLNMSVFVSYYMHSELEEYVREEYSFYEGVSPYYILEEFQERCPEAFDYSPSDLHITSSMLEWMAAIYRLWYYYTGDNSGTIYDKAPVEYLCQRYYDCHDMLIENAIDEVRRVSG